MIDDATTLIESLRIITITITMLYASYYDWKLREVDDKVWIVSGSVGTILTMIYLLIIQSLDYIILSAISIGLTIGISLALYYVGAYGGADAKALMVISLTIPVRWPNFHIHPFTSLYSFTNGLLISIVIPTYFLIYNIFRIVRGEKIFDGIDERTIRKVFACFIGTLLKDAKERKFWFPMEKIVDEKRKFQFSPLIDIDVKVNRDVMWMTPGIPLLIFITAGFIASILFGDILGYILRIIFKW